MGHMELAKQQRTIVDKKSMNTKKIGDYLRSQRETQGMELMQISEYTKININVLKRLEATDFDSLPSKAYVRGFVQNYCRAIRGNTKEALGVLDYSYREYFGKDVEVEEDVLQDTQTQDVVHHLPETELKKTFGKVPSTIGPSPLTLFFEQFSKIISNKNFYLPLAAILIVVGISLSLYKFVSRKVTENVAPIEVAKNTESTGDIKPKDASLFLLEKAKNMQVVDEKKEEVTTAEQVEQAATNEVASREKVS